MNHEFIEQTLQTSPPIKDARFPNSFVSLLAESVHICAYKAGEIIVEEGGAYSCLFVVVDGVVAVYKNGKYQGNMMERSIFGESVVFDLTARQSNTIVALQYCVVLAVPRSAFVAALFRHPDEVDSLARLKQSAASQLHLRYGMEDVSHPWAKSSNRDTMSEVVDMDRDNLMYIATERDSYPCATFVTNPESSIREVFLMQQLGFSTTFLMVLDKLGVPFNARSGSQIVREGGPDKNQCLCWLKSGNARVTRSSTEVSRLVEGDLFGEAAVFEDNGTHSVRVVATTACVGVSYSREALNEAIMESPVDIQRLELLKDRLQDQCGVPRRAGGSKHRKNNVERSGVLTFATVQEGDEEDDSTDSS